MKFSKGISMAVIIVAVVGLIISAAMYLIFNNLQSRVSLLIGDGAYQAQVATTPQARDKGLSGVTSLKQVGAILMIFPSDDNWKIWMKDMKIPIDIVWLNKDKKVVYMVNNASPDDGANTMFTPTAKARYVVELAAGSIDSARIRTNLTAIFSVNDKDVQ